MKDKRELGKDRILLVSRGLFEKEFLERIGDEVTRQFRFPVAFEEINTDLTDFYDPVRRQYDGNAILNEIQQLPAESCIKKIGLFRVDLFIPILTYIFGQAELNGNTGIASLYRLRNEQYGMPKDDRLLAERFIKVVIHELGHTFGLIHCHLPSCVMRSSTYVEDIDQKSGDLCTKCRTTLERS